MTEPGGGHVKIVTMGTDRDETLSPDLAERIINVFAAYEQVSGLQDEMLGMKDDIISKLRETLETKDKIIALQKEIIDGFESGRFN